MINIKKNNKAQITIFVIIGLILVVSLILLFLLIKEPSITEVKISSTQNPQAYLEDCIEETIQDPINIILKQGGNLNPENYVLYNNTKITYVCYINEAYKPCIMQYPMYLEHIRNQIKEYSKPRIEECFNNLIIDLNKKNYEVNGDSIINNFDVQIKPNAVIVNIDKKISYSKNEQEKSFSGFEFKIISPLYDLIKVSQEIANQEARFCNFEYLGYMALYPEFDIRKTLNKEGGNIYTIKDYLTKQEMNIAIRGCYFPPGLV